jgi:hypothetical protein
MSEKIDEIKRLINDLREHEQHALYTYLRTRVAPHPLETKWGLTADVILGAINRAPDLTQRGIRGVIAEAVFESEVLPLLTAWESQKLEGDLPYDFKLKERGGETAITVQVKLQRSERGAPKRGTGSIPKEFFIVEVQKTRSGVRTVKPASEPGAVVEEVEIQTRPYSLGDFDILAVNMHPSTNDWSRFMYTVGNWLILRKANAKLIEIMQPVSEKRSQYWTDNLEECIAWLKTGEKRSISDLLATKTSPAEKATKSNERGEI